MAITCGFFNSVNGDRKYHAGHMSSIFNGIINDGVFMSVGECFMIKPSSGNEISVGIGRSWFNGTWMYNDAIMLIETEPANTILNRIDAVVIEVNHSDSVREATIKMVYGTPASTAVRPTLTNTNLIHQYPIAYINRKVATTEIVQADITNMVGTSVCPYVTGILETIDATQLLAQWQDQFDRWFNGSQTDWDEWFAAADDQWTRNLSDKQDQWDTWYENETTTNEQEIAAWRTLVEGNFDAWFEALQVTFADDVAVTLANKVFELERAALLNMVNNFNSRTTAFNADGSIVATDDAGNTCTTAFNSDGSITETYVTVAHGTMIKTVTFEADGSINEVINK